MAMKIFTEVADRGGFTAAAEHLDLSRSMVTRHVTELERWLGSRLLQRSTRKVSLTDAGEACLNSCRQMLAISQELQDISGKRDIEPHGQLRITSSVSFGATHLTRAITDYLEHYPKVTIDLLLLDRSVNLIEERVDLAIRIAGELDPNIVARKIAPCKSIICATPKYLERHGAPEHPDDLQHHNCFTYTNFGKSEWRLSPINPNSNGDVVGDIVGSGQVNDEEITVPVTGNLRVNEAAAITQAILDNAGIALQPSYIAGPLIQQGKLVKLLNDWEPAELGIWGVYLSRHHVSAAQRTFLDFLVKRFKGIPDWEI